MLGLEVKRSSGSRMVFVATFVVSSPAKSMASPDMRLHVAAVLMAAAEHMLTSSEMMKANYVTMLTFFARIRVLILKAIPESCSRTRIGRFGHSYEKLPKKVHF